MYFFLCNIYVCLCSICMYIYIYIYIYISKSPAGNPATVPGQEHDQDLEQDKETRKSHRQRWAHGTVQCLLTFCLVMVYVLRHVGPSDVIGKHGSFVALFFVIRRHRETLQLGRIASAEFCVSRCVV